MVTGNASITDTSNVVQSASSADIRLEAADNTDVYGIWVGTGNTAVAVSDYTLDTKIDHGTGAGELDYNANTYIAATISGDNIVYKVYRTFANGSGGPITIEEVGLIAKTVDPYYYLILRDTKDANGVALSIAVPDGQTATVTYTFTQTQASGFVKQFFQFIEGMNFGQTMEIKYVGGSGSTVSMAVRSHTKWLLVASAAGVITHGIVVGTNNTALSNEDYELNSIIAHGSGSGQLSYSAVTNENVAVDGDDVTFVIKRTMTNNSGNTINIEEAGLYNYGYEFGGYNFMIIRLLTSTLDIEAGESVTAKYTFKHTV
jgi:hypothetical protein